MPPRREVAMRGAAGRANFGGTSTHGLRGAIPALLALVLSSCSGGPDDPVSGVEFSLAEERAGAIYNLSYDLVFDLPADPTVPVTGTVGIDLSLSKETGRIVLDFKAPAGNVKEVRLNGQPVDYRTVNEHIVIPAGGIRAGDHRIDLAFTSTDAALNRQEEFLYSLFVPDRASSAFPVFEQPNLKARFTLALNVPREWEALSNGELLARESVDDTYDRVSFAETEPISTYIFAFAAGRFEKVKAERDGRHFTMFHRETDTSKVAANSEAIFDLHSGALKWLEDYTGIPYPFGKFEFLAVPAFQFGGMEHPGAVWYRADALFLDASATRNQELGRASLIAHETAHMWFGDLVTMRWFNDVWMKEVFANFMAAKIVGPSFPDVDLDLRFFQAHHPSAYAVDRTPGSNPIRQELGNMNEAGSLYGAIIYQKAPIVMEQLERLIGENAFRDGLRTYLQRYSFGNATWPELISILNEPSEYDLKSWSSVWVEQPGRATLEAFWTENAVRLRHRSSVWPQKIVVAAGVGDSVIVVEGTITGANLSIPLELEKAPDFLLVGADGVGYGRFPLDSAGIENLLGSVATLHSPLHRGVAWQSLYEELLDGRLDPERFITSIIRALENEGEELITLQLLGHLRSTYWRHLNRSERSELAPRVESALWSGLDSAGSAGLKGAYFNSIMAVTLSSEGIDRLVRIWRKLEAPVGLPLEEQQYIALSEAIALRGVSGYEAILDEQESRITNPDRVARFKFVRDALSSDVAVRRARFLSFADPEMRRRESWVLDAMSLINHPLRADEAVEDIRASLELVEEIQRTGDIFFPLRWLNATLDGHSSVRASQTVNEFLEEKGESLPPKLRGKVLQAADGLHRAARRNP